MKNKLFLCVAFTSLFFSCSKDDNGGNGKTDAKAIVGTWQATELKIDDNTASDAAKNGRDILNYLTAKNCYILVFTFNEDLSVVAENSGNYLEIGVNSSGTGLEIPCPTEKDTDTTTYSYDGKVLTYVDKDGVTNTINASIDGNTLSLDAAGLDIPNFNASGELIFERK